MNIRKEILRINNQTVASRSRSETIYYWWGPMGRVGRCLSSWWNRKYEQLSDCQDNMQDNDSCANIDGVPLCPSMSPAVSFMNEFLKMFCIHPFSHLKNKLLQKLNLSFDEMVSLCIRWLGWPYHHHITFPSPCLVINDRHDTMISVDTTAHPDPKTKLCRSIRFDSIKRRYKTFFPAKLHLHPSCTLHICPAQIPEWIV